MAAGSGGRGTTGLLAAAGALLVILVLLACVGGTTFFVRNQERQARDSLAGGGPGAGPGASAAPAPSPAKTPAASAPGVIPSPPPAAPPTGQCPPPGGASATGVRVGLTRLFTPGAVISFGLPLPHGAQVDPGALRVTAGGAPIAATTRVLLNRYGPDGAPQGPRAILVQLPASVLAGDCAEVAITWAGGSATAPAASGNAPQLYAAVSAPSATIVETATRTIRSQGGRATLVETARTPRTLFTGREPTVLATFPPGYLATTGILGPTLAGGQLGPDFAGLRFIAEQATPFALSGSYQEGYPLNPAAVVGPGDTDERAGINGYEGWLYDRCATYLVIATTTGDNRFWREGFRSCSYYASQIERGGENRGSLKITPEPDDKYSHLRGLYAYYALTGDEAALEAGRAIADLWLRDPFVITPYRAGQLRGPDKLWTERQLGVGLEGLVYGHLLTGDPAYLRATREVVTTAHRHATGDAAALAAITPDSAPFPPQNCLIHNAEQASEGNPDQPWCSGWMPILLLDALLAYQEQTADPRVDEIFIRLTRFLRDTGSSYFQGDVLNDDFLHPSVAYDPRQDLADRRILIPLYGAGIDQNGRRQTFGEYDDTQHCLDATTLTAVGLRALRRTGTYDRNPIGPFASEGESFLALHHELAFCASVTFLNETRAGRDPAAPTPEELANGLSDPAAYINENEIGFPRHNTAPQRKLSWWFNTSPGQFGLLRDAGITVPELRPGAVQPGR